MHTTVHGDREPKTQLAGEMNDNAVNATRSSRVREDTTGNGGILSWCGTTTASSED